MCRIINLIDKTSKAAVRLILSNASMFPLRIKTKTYYLILEYKHLSNTSAKTIKNKLLCCHFQLLSDSSQE